MSALSPQASRHDRSLHLASRRDRRLGLRVLLAATTATAVPGAGVLHGPPKPAHAGERYPAKRESPGPGQELPQEFVDRIERILAVYDRRLTALTNVVFEDIKAVQQVRSQVVNGMMEARKAEADFINAQLARELAEIAVKEYVEGIAVQDRQIVENERALSNKDVERAHREVAEAKVRLARITAATDNSAFGLNLQYLYTDRLSSAEVIQKKAELELEAVECKRKVLLEYTIPKRIRELQSDVKKARSDELAKQAMAELSQSKSEKVRKESKRADLPADRKRILLLIDDAIPLEEKIRAKLAEVNKAKQLPDATAAEIDQWEHDLGAIVDRAESQRDASDFARLKPGIRQTAILYRNTAPK